MTVPDNDVSSGDSPQQSGGPPRRRGFASVGDIVRSLVVVIGFVVAILLLTPRPGGDPVRTVDVGPALTEARSSAPYDVVAPVALPDDWRATSARTERTAAAQVRWHVGYVTPAGKYAAVEQGDGPTQDLLEALGVGRDAGVVMVAGQPWHRRDEGAGGRRSLWRSFAGSTVVVTGTSGWEELSALAGTLRPS